MSKEREEVTVGTPPVAPVETREQKRARLVQVLDRGVVQDRLRVDLPNDLHGEWVPNDKLEIHSKEALGFRIDTEYAVKRALHSKGDSASYVGDCVFMICEKETKELIDEIKREQYNRLNHKSAVQKEERDFTKQTSQIGLEALNEGTINEARKAELESALGVTKD